MYEHPSQPRTPARSCGSLLPDEVVQEIRQRRDTVAGIAHRYGLQVSTVLDYWEQCLDQGIQAGPVGYSKFANLLEPGITPTQSRLSGVC